MYHSRRQRIYSALWIILGALLFCNLALAITSEVRDDGGFFSADAIRKANDGIREIRQRFHKDLLIETVKTVPPENAEAKSTDPSIRRRFFSEWTRVRARDARVNGIYVLITRHPGHVEVAVGDRTRQSGEFTFADQARLQELLVSNFRKKEYDKGLIEAVEFVRTRFAEASSHRASTAPNINRPGASNLGEQRFPQSQPTISSSPVLKWLFILIAIAVAVWIFRAIGRALTARSAASSVQPPGSGVGGGFGGMGGGGGFWSGMLGGLFGAAAGSWLYDSFFRGSSAPQAYSGPEGSQDTRAEDQDYSTTGSDFDTADSGGEGYESGDFGGDSGDFGGGDFGGGDFGGGGFGDS